MFKKITKIFVGALAVTSLVVAPAHAQWAVIDGSNLIENIINVITATKNEVSTAATLVQQIQGTINLGKSIESMNGVSSLAGLQQELNLYQQLANTSGQMVNTLNQSQQLNSNVMAQIGASGGTSQQFLAGKTTITAQQSQSLQAQYKNVISEMTAIATRRQNIVNQLQGVGGQTAAMQSVGTGIDALIGQNQLMLSTLAAQGNSTLVKQNVDAASKQQAQTMNQTYQQKLINSDAALSSQ